MNAVVAVEVAPVVVLVAEEDPVGSLVGGEGGVRSSRVEVRSRGELLLETEEEAKEEREWWRLLLGMLLLLLLMLALLLEECLEEDFPRTLEETHFFGPLMIVIYN